MAEEKDRGVDNQLPMEGDINEPENPQGGVNTTTEIENDSDGLLTQEEFENLIKALDEGNFEEFFATLDPELQKKYQSYMDSKIQKALKTREKNLRKQIEEQLKKEAELKQLEAEGKWKELYEAKQQELEEQLARLQQERIDVLLTAKLNEKRLPLEFKKFVSVNDPEQIDSAVEELSRLVDSYVQKKIEDLKATSNVVMKNRVSSTSENSLENEVKRYIEPQGEYKKPW